MVSVEAAPANLVEAPTAQAQALFGYGREDLKLVIAPMARDGKEAVWSMGDDTPVSALARVPRSVYSYFRQRFAQVTNPPIDPLREDLMMSLRTVLGRKPSLCPMDLEESVTQLELASPIIGEWDLRGIRSQSLVKVAEIECVCAESEPLEQTLRGICQLAEGAVRSGAELLVLSDQSASPTCLPIPMAIAVGAVHHHLIGAGLRTHCDVTAETGAHGRQPAGTPANVLTTS